MSILFYCTFKNKDQWLRSIKKKFKKEIVYTPNNKLDYSKINYAIVWNLPDKIYSKLNNIKIIFSLGAGVDHIIKLPSYRKTPIIRVKDVNMAKRMSYHVHSQILSYQLKLYLFHQHSNLYRKDTHIVNQNPKYNYIQQIISLSIPFRILHQYNWLFVFVCFLISFVDIRLIIQINYFYII